MTSLAGEIFDSLPDRCPGCGMIDTPAENGPSKLMFIWAWMLNSYLCLACNQGYTAWLGNKYVNEEEKNKHKPRCVLNIDAIARGAEPAYDAWISNPMSYFGRSIPSAP